MTLRIEGEKFDLGICSDYEEWFGGDVVEVSYRTGPYTVEVKIGHRKENGSLYRIEMDD